MEALSFGILMGTNFGTAPSLFQILLSTTLVGLADGLLPHTQGNGQNKKPFSCAKLCFPQVDIDIPVNFRESIGEDLDEVTLDTPQRSAPAHRLARFLIE